MGKDGGATDTIVLTSADPVGTKFVISAPSSSATSQVEKKDKERESKYNHFDEQLVKLFLQEKKGSEGIAVLCLRVGEGGTAMILKNYQEKVT